MFPTTEYLQTDIMNKVLDAEITTLAIAGVLVALWVVLRVITSKSKDDAQDSTERQAFIELIKEFSSIIQAQNTFFKSSTAVMESLVAKVDHTNETNAKMIASIEILTDKMANEFACLRQSFEEGFGLLVQQHEQMITRLEKMDQEVKNNGSESPSV